MGTHIKKIHDDILNGTCKDHRMIKCPYNVLLNENFCIVGCGFRSTTKSELRVHLIMWHS
jgi:hypothetical protein